MECRWALSAGHDKYTWNETGGKGIVEPDGNVFEEFTFNRAVVEKLIELIDYNNQYVLKYDMINYRLLNQDLDGRSSLGEKIRYENYLSPVSDLLFSVHANYNDNKSLSGNWTFYWHTSTNGKILADIMQKYKKKWLPNKIYSLTGSRENHWTNFGILRETNAPAILEEFAFFSNDNDRELLKSELFQWQCARALFETGCEYCGITGYTLELTPIVKPDIPKEPVEPLPDPVDVPEIPVDEPEPSVEPSLLSSLLKLLLSFINALTGRKEG